MRASSITIRVKRCADIRGWSWWGLPPLLRWYVLALPAAALTLLGAVAAVHTAWHWPELYKFLVLMCCGIISVASTPRIMYSYPGLTRDFTAIWVLPAAILLPPFYAAVVPIPLLLTLHIYVHRGVVHRMVFTAATLSLCYGAASFMFRWFPGTFAGNSVGSGFHAFTWCIAVAACELVASRAQYFLILGAVKLSNPKVKLGRGERDREALQARFVEVDLAVLITLAVGLSPALVVIALPTVLLVRRFLVFPILEAQSRTDAKTGLLNVSTWESETEAELSRAVRLRKPLAIALIDIDHFKTVNDTYGHLVGDRVLKAIADALASTRDYDRVGRFGGEEFVILLAETTEEDACTVAQRLRADVAALAIPVDDRPDAPVVQVTISIGVTALAKGETSELTDLLAAADSALYHAKQSGRNCVAYAPPEQNMGLDAFRAELGTPRGGSLDTAARAHASTPVQATSVLGNHRAVLVQSDQTALSLRRNRSLSALMRRHREFTARRRCPPQSHSRVTRNGRAGAPGTPSWCVMGKRAPAVTGYELEHELAAAGHRVVAGIDEVGRGAWAGPVVVCATVIRAGFPKPPVGLTDSKLLTPKRRAELAAELPTWVEAYAIGAASHQEIDAHGMTAALRLAAHRALAQLPQPPDVVLLDGKHDYIGSPWRVRTAVKADLRSVSVAAASVLAKVHRDTLLAELGKSCPEFGFADNAGYPAPVHQRALAEHGPTPYHRLSWAYLDDLPAWRHLRIHRPAVDGQLSLL